MNRDLEVLLGIVKVLTLVCLITIAILLYKIDTKADSFGIPLSSIAYSLKELNKKAGDAIVGSGIKPAEYKGKYE